jgi:antitoxin (DNA-binding transcriptional repressor) of toxin-antitoxin stability system
MKQAKISELKDNLSRSLEYVRKGGTVRVLDRDTPVADLVPLGSKEASTGSPDWNALLDEQERRGTVKRGSGKLPPGFLSRKLPRPKASVVEALLEERREGR